MKIKLNVLTLAAAISAVVLTGCQYPNGEPNNTASGALIGGAMGAIAGAAIGGPRNGGAGALIGAAAGAITGGVIGNSMDQEQAAELRAQAPQTYVRVQQGQPLSLADVKALAAARVSDDVIINQIRNSHTVFHLSTADIIDLHNSGVSENVINFMINSPSLAGDDSTVQTTTDVTEAPPPPPAETVVVAPGPGYVWVGGEWAWNGRWVWRAGYWAYPPYPRAVWVGGYWGRGPYGWYWRRGHWR
ncbi:MAG: YXWGXW repeat-containing protein [Limisphaerales bacterium]